MMDWWWRRIFSYMETFDDEKRLCLGAFPLSQDGFRFEIQYRDDQTGIPSNVFAKCKTPGMA